MKIKARETSATDTDSRTILLLQMLSVNCSYKMTKVKVVMNMLTAHFVGSQLLVRHL